MKPDSVAAVPGLAGVNDDGLNALAEVVDRHGWDVDGLAAAIAHESAWNPGAVNASTGATGLIQFLPKNLGRWGTNAGTVARMSVAAQLPLVERFFAQWEAAGYTIGPRDFLAFGLGVGNVKPRPGPGESIPDDAVLYEAGSDGASYNPGFQDPDGAIRMGMLRRKLEGILRSAAGRPRIAIPVGMSPKARLARLQARGRL